MNALILNIFLTYFYMIFVLFIHSSSRIKTPNVFPFEVTEPNYILFSPNFQYIEDVECKNECFKFLNNNDDKNKKNKKENFNETYNRYNIIIAKIKENMNKFNNFNNNKNYYKNYNKNKYNINFNDYSETPNCSNFNFFYKNVKNEDVANVNKYSRNKCNNFFNNDDIIESAYLSNGKIIMNEMKKNNFSGELNSFILIYEISTHKIQRYLKSIFDKNLSRRRFNEYYEYKIYLLKCKGKSNELKKESYNNLSNNLYNSNEEKKHIYHSKNKKRKKKKKEGIIDNHKNERNEEFIKSKTRNNIFYDQKCTLCINKNLGNNMIFTNIINKCAKYKILSLEFIICPIEKDEKKYSLLVSKSIFSLFMKIYHREKNSKIFIDEKRKKESFYENSHTFVNKKTIWVFDCCKKEEISLIFSFDIKEQDLALIFQDCNSHLINNSDYIINDKKIYENDEYYKEDKYMRKDENILQNSYIYDKNQEICYNNNNDYYIDKLKDIFFQSCKYKNEKIFKKNKYFPNVNKIKNFHTNNQLNSKHERETVFSINNEKKNCSSYEKEKRTKKEEGNKYNYQIYYNTYKHVNIKSKKMWDNLHSDIYLNYVKGFYYFYFYIFRRINIYKNLLNHKYINEEQNSKYTSIDKQVNVNNKTSLENSCNCNKYNTNYNNNFNSNNISNNNNYNNFNCNNDKCYNGNYYYYSYINYSKNYYKYEINKNLGFFDDIYINKKLLFPVFSVHNKSLIRNMKKYLKEGIKISIYIDHMSPEIYNCNKYKKIKWALIIFFIPAWLIINIVYIILVQKMWRQMLNPLHRLLISPSLIRLSFYILLLTFCMQCPYVNSNCVEYTLMGYMALNTMFSTIFHGNLLLISKGYMITRGNFDKKESIGITLIISSIYILTSINQVDLNSNNSILICLYITLLLILVINILSIIKFLKLKLSFVRDARIHAWEESINVKLNMYKAYLTVVVIFFCFEIILHILSMLFKSLSGNLTLVEYTLELVMWCCVLYIFRYRGDVLYFSLLYDNSTLHILPLYIASTDVSDITEAEKNEISLDYNKPILILNPFEYNRKYFLSCITIGIPYNMVYKKIDLHNKYKTIPLYNFSSIPFNYHIDNTLYIS
ncbi:conserved Plasmodium protein, unknown function [Plasmodium gallinaceum]|uniref:Uncharacterized protein n=1 Tax=Plasmodium gallinaceum TaxID=5849 RepID=A0A1J1GQU0_PLAGA|nr:conserved Plasmodium protein, unknown function [Plasmodium gallinaceum]CRG94658.1 conserved Plasmodium protein, unknown function [Plasmodium gallinaceum]